MKTFEYRNLLPPFPAESRVWVYQSARLLSISEALQAEDFLTAFAANWQSHGAPVKAWASLFFGQFIVLMADDSHNVVGGCSTDNSVRSIKELESRLGTSLFDRQSLGFIIKDKVQLLPLSQFSYAVENGFINGDTLYFNNTVQTKQDLEINWIIPINQSWLAGKLKAKAGVR